MIPRTRILTLNCVAVVAALLSSGQQQAVGADKKSDEPVMKPYTEQISGVDASFDMLPIPGGEFMMGSPESETDRKEDEGPQVKVKIEPFWMGKTEVTWGEYDIWSFRLDIQRRNLAGETPTKLDTVADAVTRPTPPYTDMTFGMGHDGYPAICMTQHAAKFCVDVILKSVSDCDELN